MTITSSPNRILNTIGSYPQAINAEVRGWSKDKVLGIPANDQVASLVQKYKLDVPELLVDAKFMSHSGEARMQCQSAFKTDPLSASQIDPFVCLIEHGASRGRCADSRAGGGTCGRGGLTIGLVETGGIGDSPFTLLHGS